MPATASSWRSRSAPGRRGWRSATCEGSASPAASIPTPTDLEPPALLERIVAALRSLLRDEGLPDERLLAACAASPGLVDRETGTVVALAPSLGHWSNVKVGPLLAAELGVPVRVENDVNLAVVGEHWKGAARGHDTCAYIHVGAGVGAGS